MNDRDKKQQEAYRINLWITFLVMRGSMQITSKTMKSLMIFRSLKVLNDDKRKCHVQLVKQLKWNFLFKG